MANIAPFLDKIAKEYLLRLLKLCRAGERGMFQAMYAKDKEESLETTVLNLDPSKVDHAVFQVENSLDKTKTSLFTAADIKKYIQSQDSLGDALYDLTPAKIVKALNEFETKNDS